jgi:hypothetical protein
MQLFGDLDVLSFAGTCRLNCIGHVNRTDSKRKVSRYLIIIPGKSTKRTTKKQMLELCTDRYQ